MPDLPNLEHRRAVAERHAKTIVAQAAQRGTPLTEIERSMLAVRRHEVEECDRALAAQRRVSASLTDDLPPLGENPTSLALRQRRGALLAKAEALLDIAEEQDGKLSFDELAAYQSLTDAIESLTPQLAAAEERERKARADLAAKSELRRQQEMNPNTVADDRIEAAWHGGTLKSFSNDRAGRERAYRAGQWLRAAFTGAGDARRFCEEHGVGVQAALSGSINTAGGVLVPEELARAIIDLREEYGLARRRCRVVPMGSDTLLIPRRVGGVTAYFVGENAEGTESDASWDNVSLSAKKLMVLTRMSSEIAEDSVINLADYLAREIAYSFASKEDSILLNGDGTSTYGGMVGVLVKALDGSHSMAKVTRAATHDTLAEVDLDDLTAMIAAVPEYAKPGSAWICSSEAEAVIFHSLLASTGGITPSGLAGPLARSFLGYPIEVSPAMPSSLTTDYSGAAMLGFGNLGLAATLGSRREIRVALSDQRYWSSDQIGVKGTERFDLVVHDLGSNSDKSPFVVLVGGAS